MGSPVSPVITDIFMEDLEDNAFASYQGTPRVAEVCRRHHSGEERRRSKVFSPTSKWRLLKNEKPAALELAHFENFFFALIAAQETSCFGLTCEMSLQNCNTWHQNSQACYFGSKPCPQ